MLTPFLSQQYSLTVGGGKGTLFVLHPQILILPKDIFYPWEYSPRINILKNYFLFSLCTKFAIMCTKRCTKVCVVFCTTLCTTLCTTFVQVFYVRDHMVNHMVNHMVYHKVYYCLKKILVFSWKTFRIKMNCPRKS